MMTRIEMRISESEIWCEDCKRMITADNISLVEAGEMDKYMFIHDDVPHQDPNIL